MSTRRRMKLEVTLQLNIFTAGMNFQFLKFSYSELTLGRSCRTKHLVTGPYDWIPQSPAPLTASTCFSLAQLTQTLCTAL